MSDNKWVGSVTYGRFNKCDVYIYRSPVTNQLCVADKEIMVLDAKTIKEITEIGCIELGPDFSDVATTGIFLGGSAAITRSLMDKTRFYTVAVKYYDGTSSVLRLTDYGMLVMHGIKGIITIAPPTDNEEPTFKPYLEEQAQLLEIGLKSFGGKVLPLNASEYEEKVIKSDKPVLIYAINSKYYSPLYNEAHSLIKGIIEYKNFEITIYQIDLADQEISNKLSYNGSMAPVLLLFNDGEMTNLGINNLEYTIREINMKTNNACNSFNNNKHVDKLLAEKEALEKELEGDVGFFRSRSIKERLAAIERGLEVHMNEVENEEDE